MIEGLQQHVEGGGPALEPDSPRLVGADGDERHLFVHPFGVTASNTDEAESAGVGHRCSEHPASGTAHGSEHDRVLELHHGRESRRQRHLDSLISDDPALDSGGRSTARHLAQ